MSDKVIRPIRKLTPGDGFLVLGGPSASCRGFFMITTCTVSLRTANIPYWMAFLGQARELFLLLSLGFAYWAPTVFPLWVLLISVQILLANLGKSKDAPAAEFPI